MMTKDDIVRPIPPNTCTGELSTWRTLGSEDFQHLQNPEYSLAVRGATRVHLIAGDKHHCSMPNCHTSPEPLGDCLKHLIYIS